MDVVSTGGFLCTSPPGQVIRRKRREREKKSDSKMSSSWFQLFIGDDHHLLSKLFLSFEEEEKTVGEPILSFLLPFVDERQADELGNYQQHQEMCYPHLVILKMHRSRTPSDTLMATPLLIWSESYSLVFFFIRSLFLFYLTFLLAFCCSVVLFCFRWCCFGFLSVLLCTRQL